MKSKALASLLLLAASCSPTPMRWEKPGAADPAGDEAACRAAAHDEAARRLPYGYGPPVFGYWKVSMIEWTQAIDNERSFLAEDLTKVCMRGKGYALVPAGQATFK